MLEVGVIQLSLHEPISLGKSQYISTMRMIFVNFKLKIINVFGHTLEPGLSYLQGVRLVPPVKIGLSCLCGVLAVVVWWQSSRAGVVVGPQFY